MTVEWTKMDDQTICKYNKPQIIYSEQLTPRISSIFNFRSKKVHLSITDLNASNQVAIITTENFSDQESDNEIQEAYQELIKLGGNPKLYSREKDGNDKANKTNFKPKVLKG